MVNEASTKLKHTVMELASGAKLILDDDGDWRLVKSLPQPDGVTIAELMHCGWLESMANGGTCKLSDEGLKAYLKSSDELGDGKLYHPHEWIN